LLEALYIEVEMVLIDRTWQIVPLEIIEFTIALYLYLLFSQHHYAVWTTAIFLRGIANRSIMLRLLIW